MKSRNALFGIAALLAAGSVIGAALAADPARRGRGEESTRTSTFGTLTDKMIRKDEDMGIDGTFDDGGKIITKENSATDRFEGIWTTPKGEQPCSTEQGGTKNWGKIWFKLSEMGRTFTGKWGYCDKEPDQDFTAKWDGK